MDLGSRASHALIGIVVSFILLQVCLTAALAHLRNVDRPGGATARPGLLSRLGLPLQIFLLALVVKLNTNLFLDGASEARKGHQAAELLSLLALAWLLVALFTTALFEVYFKKLRGFSVPGVLQGVSSLGLYVLTAALVFSRYIGDLDRLAIPAASASLVLGIGLQDIFGSLFAGMSMSFEHNVRIGDHVKVGDFEGLVVGTNWRTLQLRTFDNHYVIIPNKRFANDAVVNYSLPDKLQGGHFSLQVEHSAPPNQVKDLLLQCALLTPGVLTEPTPTVFALRVLPGAIEYLVNFWVEDSSRSLGAMDELISRTWYMLDRRGFKLPANSLRVEMPARWDESQARRGEQILRWFMEIPLFSAIREPELQRLAQSASVQRFGRGEVIFRHGDPGEQFFIVIAGAVSVAVPERSVVNGKSGARGERIVATLGPGDFFGERSLLTGEVRSATLTATADSEFIVIDKRQFHEVLLADSGAAERLCQVMVRTAAHNRESQSTTPASSSEESNTLLARLKAFFRLS